MRRHATTGAGRLLVLWVGLVPAGAGAEIVSYHSGMDGGYVTSSADAYVFAVKFDLPKPGRTYRVDAIRIRSQGPAATFPAGTRIAIQLFDGSGAQIYESGEYDLSGGDASLGTRRFIMSGDVIVEGSFRAGGEQRGSAHTFRFVYDWPFSNQYARSWIYDVELGEWDEYQEDFMIDAEVTAVSAISVSDGYVVEGDTGTTNMVFDVTLSQTNAASVAVDFSTLTQSAQAGVDYAATTGRLVIASGETSARIEVPVFGDTDPEGGTEMFLMNVFNATNGTILDGQGVGTVIDDDGGPRRVLSQNGRGTYAGGTNTLHPDSTSLESFTVEAWFRARKPHVYIFSDDAYDLVLHHDATEPGNGLGLKFTLRSEMEEHSIMTYGALTLREWHHVAAMYNAATDRITMSLDGDVIVGPTFGVGSFRSSPGQHFAAGGGPSGRGASAFDGFLDEVRVSDVVRYSSDFVPTIEHSPDGNTVALYRFNESPGSTTFADSGVAGLELKGGQDSRAREVEWSLISVGDLTVTEGDSGTVWATFPVEMTDLSLSPVMLDYGTSNITAMAADDYVATNGQLTIPVGERTASIAARIQGDVKDEGAWEHFAMLLSNAVSATIFVHEGRGSIIEDDGSRGALWLDGSGDRAEGEETIHPTSTNLESFTVEAWVLPYEKATGLIASDDAYDLKLKYDTAGANDGFGISFSVRAPGVSIASVQFRQVAVGKWSHIAGMFDGSTKSISIAVDGFVSAPTAFETNALRVSPVQNFAVGGRYWDNTETFHGYIDEVRVSDVVRYTERFFPARHALDTNTLALFHFDEPPGSTTFADSSGNGHHLTATSDAEARAAPGDESIGLSLLPAYRAVSSSSGEVAFAVANTTTGTMVWTAVAEDDWLSVVSGASGTNVGTLTVAYAALDGSTRTGRVTVTGTGVTNGPQTVEVRQYLEAHYYADAVLGSDLMGDGTSTNPWSSIQFALERIATPHAALHVAPGTYVEAVRVPQSCQGIDLLGAGSGKTVIDASSIVSNGAALTLPSGGGHAVTTPRTTPGLPRSPCTRSEWP